MGDLIFTPCPLLDCYESGHHSHVRFAATSCDGDHGPSALGTRCYSPRVIDPDAELIDALREASWLIENSGERPDPLPGLPEARDLLNKLRELGWTVIRAQDEAVMGDE